MNEQGWQPIATIPKFDRVIVWSPNRGLCFACLLHGEIYRWEVEVLIDDATHWRNLPDPPVAVEIPQ